MGISIYSRKRLCRAWCYTKKNQKSSKDQMWTNSNYVRKNKGYVKGNCVQVSLQIVMNEHFNSKKL